VAESISPIQGLGLLYDRAAEHWPKVVVDQGEGAAELIKSEAVPALEAEEEICSLLVAVQLAKAGCQKERQQHAV
jgi:hypothetical protein